MGYFDKFSNKGVPFMDNRDKGEFSDLIGKQLHIDQFGFIQGKDGEYPVIAFSEIADKFFFGNAIIGEMLRTVQADGMEKELAKQVITFDKRKSKSGRDYYGYSFE